MVRSRLVVDTALRDPRAADVTVLSGDNGPGRMA